MSVATPCPSDLQEPLVIIVLNGTVIVSTVCILTGAALAL
jgi:hypothetical protein